MLTLVILIATVLVLATQRMRPDLAAVCATLCFVLTGILTPGEAFGAFGQPVIVIVASIYVIGAALYETGVAILIADKLARVSQQGLAILIPVVMLTAGLLSAVLSSMLVIALLMPAVLRIARRARVSPSQLLLPLVSGATMGNLLTLIGTVSTLVVSDLLAVGGHDRLTFLSVTPYGLVSLAVSILWYTLAGRRLLPTEMPPEPRQPSLDQIQHAYHLDKQLYRLRVRSVSNLVGQRLEDSPLGTARQLNVLAVQPAGRALHPAQPAWVLEPDDLLIVEGTKGDVLQAASLHHLEPKGAISLADFNLLEEESLRLAEVMIPFRSQLVGRTLASIGFRERYGLNILAVHRQGKAIHDALPRLILASGDSLLVQGSISRLMRVGEDLNLVLVTHLGPRPGEVITRKAKLALAILGAMLICVVSGLLPLATASLAAAVLLILSGCISLDKAYRSLSGSVIVLVGGMLPLAMALEKSGVAEWIARQLVDLGAGIGPLGTLMLIYLFAVLLSQVISNSATAALMTPIAISLAVAQGLPPQQFAVAMAVAVTSSYLTPLSNSDNLLVREAGRYSIRDYVVNGLPLVLVQAAMVCVVMLLLG